MAFDWYDFLALARSLRQQADTIGPEVARRTVVSRAYYAAFCFVRDYARDHLGFQPKDEAADHAALRARLRRGKTQILSERLEDLRQWRNGCDYATELPFDLANIAESAWTKRNGFSRLWATPPQQPQVPATLRGSKLRQEAASGTLSDRKRFLTPLPDRHELLSLRRQLLPWKTKAQVMFSGKLVGVELQHGQRIVPQVTPAGKSVTVLHAV